MFLWIKYLLNESSIISLSSHVDPVFIVCFLQDFHLNRVSMDECVDAGASPAGARPKKKNKKSYDLTAADRFWQKHKGRSVIATHGRH